MAAPFIPIAGFALRYGAVALAGYAIARSTSRGRFSQPVEDEMDETPDGIALKTDDGQVNASFRWHRILSLTNSGKGLSIDATALTRLKVKRIP